MMMWYGAIFTFLLWGLALGLTVWGTWYSLKQFRREILVPEQFFPISILKPLRGWESGLEENLRSFFAIDYPDFEILFSVADPKDAAIPIVQDLMRENPEFPARLVVGERRIGPNPKVNNLVQSTELARSEWMIISDSNTRVSPDYLRRLVPHLNPKIGVLCAVVAGREASRLGGHLEASYLNTFFARWTHLAEALGRPFVIGKSMCFHRNTVERIGGLETLSRYIAEDNMMGEAAKRLGLEVRVMTDPIGQFIGEYSVESFWKRHVRWGRIRKAQAPFAFLCEPLVSSFCAGVFGAFSFRIIFGVSVFHFLACHFFLWAVCDFLMVRRLEKRLRASSVLAWCLRELLSFPLWVHMALGNKVAWRGNRLQILPGGLLEG